MHVVPVELPDDRSSVTDFLTTNRWPFHATAELSPAAAASMAMSTDQVRSHWIVDGADRVGLIRLLDLDDIDDGSPQFDLRIAEKRRGSGIGTFAVAWLPDDLFSTHDRLHRIEATTRSDNAAMQAVFDRCGYRLEGRFVEAWRSDDGSYADALSYAILRREWAAGSA